MTNPRDFLKTLQPGAAICSDRQIEAIDVEVGAAELLTDSLKDLNAESGDLVPLAVWYEAAKAEHERLDKLAKRMYHVKNQLEKSILPKAMDNCDLDSFRSPELGRSYFRQTKMSGTFLDKEKGYQWLRDNGHGDIITETVNAGTLSSFLSNLINEEGIEPPDDIVKVSTYDTTTSRKYTPKG